MKSKSFAKGFHGSSGSGKAASTARNVDTSKPGDTPTSHHGSFGFSARKVANKADVSKPGNTPTAFHG